MNWYFSCVCFCCGFSLILLRLLTALFIPFCYRFMSSFNFYATFCYLVLAVASSSQPIATYLAVVFFFMRIAHSVCFAGRCILDIVRLKHVWSWSVHQIRVGCFFPYLVGFFVFSAPYIYLISCMYVYFVLSSSFEFNPVNTAVEPYFATIICCCCCRHSFIIFHKIR